jgi:TP901 family phage tail tape measure protein
MADSTLSFNVLARDNASSTFNKVAQAADGTARSFGKVSGIAKVAAGAFAGIKVGGLVTDSIGLEATFSQTMNTMAAVAKVPANEMKGLSELAIKMGADTTFSASEASTAMLELAKGGLDAATIKGGALQGTLTLAAAGGTDLATASTIASNALNTFALKGSDMASVAAALAGGANASSASVESLGEALSQVGPGATNAGLTLQDTVGVLSAFDAAGIKGSDAGTSLKTMLSRLVPTTDKARVAMENFGLKFEDAHGNFLPIGQIAEQLRTKLGGLSESTKTAALATLFGSDATRAATVLMKQGAAGIGKYIAATKDQSAAQDVANARMSGTAGALEAFKGSVETAKLQLGLFLAPAIQAGLKKLSSGVNAIVPAVKSLASLLGKGDFTKGFREVFKVEEDSPFVSFLLTVRSTAITAFNAVRSAVQSVIPVLAGFVGFLKDNQTLVGTLAAAFGAAFIAVKAYQGVMAVVTVATKAWAAAQVALNTVMSLNPIGVVVLALVALAAGLVYAYKHSEKFRNIVNAVGGALKTGFLAIVHGVTAAIHGVTAAFGAVIGFFAERVKLLPLLILGPIGLALVIFKGLGPKILTAIGNAATALLGKGRDFLVGFLNGAKAALVGVVDWIKRAPVVAVVAPFARAAIWLIENGKGLLNGFKSGVAAIAKGVGQWLYDNVIKPVVGAFAKAGDWLYQRGRGIVLGLKNGVIAVATGIGAWMYRNVIKPNIDAFMNAGTWLVQKGRAIVNGLLGGITAVLKGIGGISAWLYNNIVKPVVNRFTNAATWLTQEGRDLISGLFAGITAKMKGIGSWVKSNIVDPVVKAVKHFFGIKSPSKVFESIGRFMIAGLLKGLSTGNGTAIAKKVFGSMPKALAGLVSKGLVSVSQLPKKALDALTAIGWGPHMADLGPGLDVLDKNAFLGRVKYQGEILDLGTYRALKQAERMLGSGFHVAQGSFEASSSYSGSTHTGGGAIDVNNAGVGWSKAVSALIRAGFAAWHRTPSQGPWGHHIHALLRGDPLLSASAAGQVSDFLRGGDGLAGYRKGTPWVPNDQIALLHKGEAVVPRDVNERARRASGAGQPLVVLQVQPGGGGLDRLFLDWLRKSIQNQGGNVQVVLGTGR